MPPSILSKLASFSLFSSIFLLFSMLNFASNSVGATSLIEQVCSHPSSNFDSKLCIETLRSEQQITSSRNLFDLSVSIMRSGISNATKTRFHMENMLEKPNMAWNFKSALRECQSSYKSVVQSFNSALSEVVNDNEYITATYDLMIASTDNIDQCVEVVAREKIRDEIILSGNKVVPIFGLSAFEAVESLMQQLISPSPM